MSTENQNEDVKAGSGTTAPKRNLGISKDIVSKALVPIPAPARLDKRTAIYPNSYEFPVARLVRVFSDPKKEMKMQNGEVVEKPIISFVFATANGKQFIHSEFPIEDDDDNFSQKLEDLHQRIKHIFDECVGASRFKAEATDGETFEEMFGNVAKAFNAETYTKGEGEAAKVLPLFGNTDVYIKVTYYKDRTQFPKYPNFLQRAMVGAGQTPCELIINPTYDKIEPQEKAKVASAYSGGQNATFGDAGSAFPDFPSI